MASEVPARSAKTDLPPWPFTIGLVGGIASGKSSVAGILAEAGYVILDADREARAVLEGPELRPWILSTFGAGVVDEAGQVRRDVIAARVFRDADLLRELEECVHPVVRRVLGDQRKSALARNYSVVLDVPLLFESGYDASCELLLFVQVDDEERRARALARGMSEEDWVRREGVQLPLAEKRSRADRIVPNGGDLAATRAALADLSSYARGSARS